MTLSNDGLDEGFHRLLEAAPDAIVISDSEGRIVMVNVQAERVFGYSREEMLGQYVEMLMPDRLRDEHQTHRNAYIASPTSRPMGVAQDLWGQCKNGNIFPVEISLSPLPLESGLLIISSIRDISLRKHYENELEEQMLHSKEYAAELEQANARLTTLATIDELTQIQNRRGFREHLEMEYARARRSSQPISVAMVDVDHFKRFNDTYGHAVGDETLSTVAHIIKEVVRSEDVVGRYGGEEFALILPNTRKDHAQHIVERIRTAIGSYDWPHSPVTISVGVSTRTAAAGSPCILLEEADRALYFSKMHGRNRTTHFRDIPLGFHPMSPDCEKRL